MDSKYLFIHCTLLILFLELTHGNGHPDNASLTDNNKCQCPCPCPPPEQNNNIHVPPQAPAPGDNNKSPQPPNSNNQSPQPSGGSDQPPSGSDQPSQPPSGSNQPPSGGNNPPQPPSDGNNPPQPPSDSNKPSQPPSSSDQPPQPPSGSDQPPQPPSGSDQPPSGSDQPPQPPSGSDQSPQPPSDAVKPPQPSSDSDKSPKSPSDSDKPPPAPPAPENNNQSPPLPQNDSNNPTPTTPGNEGYEGCFSKIFAFGDSYTDTGNAFAMGGLQSFVESLKSKFPGHNLKGHRQCDGRLVVDFLCEKLALPQLPPYKQASSNFSSGANFAVAGSTAFSKDFFSKHLGHNLMWKGTPLGFQVQIDWFKKFKSEATCKGKDESACKVEMENALFWIGEIGGSDYARTFGSALSHKLSALQSLLDNGAKYLVVQGLPPLGCCPLEMFLSKASDRDQMGCSSICNSLIQAHNQHLQTMILEWQKKHPDCIIAYADYWSAYKAILANPKKYNFEEPSKACCGAGGPLNFNIRSLCGSIGTSACKDPSRYMHWDGIHLTEAMHKHITDLFLNQGYCKPSFAELVKKKRGM